MKSIKYLAAIAAVFSLASSALAQTKVYIAGAPALRTELTTAIENLFLGQAGVQRTFNGTALITANVVRWTGGTIAGIPVTIKLTYNGSAGGWAFNASSRQVRFIPDNAPVGSGATDVLSNTTTAAVELAVPDFHISNEYQESTPWTGENSVSFPENGPTSYQQLNDLITGILPLRLVASKGAPAGLNLTPQLAQQLYQNGSLRLSQLTGNASDFSARVYPLSRGIDSGIRTLWAAGNGLGTSSPIKTWNATTANTTNKPVVGVTVVAPGTGYTSAPTVTIAAPPVGGTQATATATVANGKITGFTVTNPGSGYNSAPSVSLSGGGGSLASARAVIEGGTVTSHALWPAASATGGPEGTDNRVLGINTPLGNGGYVTFGPLLTALTSTLNLPGGSPKDIYLTVLGESDAVSAIQGGAKEVKWNGNLLGTLGTYGNIDGVANNPTNVGSATPALANGQYDLWGYVRLPYRDDIGENQFAVLEAIAAQMRNFEGPVKLGDVNIQRTSDGGKIVQGQLEQ